MGLEPTLLWNSILSRARLPFRHVGTCGEKLLPHPSAEVKIYFSKIDIADEIVFSHRGDNAPSSLSPMPTLYLPTHLPPKKCGPGEVSIRNAETI